MAGMTRKNAENAQSAKALANQTRVAADAGAEIEHDVVDVRLELRDGLAGQVFGVIFVKFQYVAMALAGVVIASLGARAALGPRPLGESAAIARGQGSGILYTSHE